MSAFWSDFLTTAAVLFTIVAGTLCPPLAVIFIAALLTYLATTWIKDIKQWRNQRQRYNRTSRQ